MLPYRTLVTGNVTVAAVDEPVGVNQREKGNEFIAPPVRIVHYEVHVEEVAVASKPVLTENSSAQTDEHNGCVIIGRNS